MKRSSHRGSVPAVILVLPLEGRASIRVVADTDAETARLHLDLLSRSLALAFVALVRFGESLVGPQEDEDE